MIPKNRVSRTVSISKEQDEWMRENHISISHFFQDKLDEEMKVLVRRKVTKNE
jgi:hypothetical protein